MKSGNFNSVNGITVTDKVKVKDEAFVNGFAAFYNENNRKCGTYTYSEEQGTWTLV